MKLNALSASALTGLTGLSRGGLHHLRLLRHHRHRHHHPCPGQVRKQQEDARVRCEHEPTSMEWRAVKPTHQPCKQLQTHLPRSSFGTWTSDACGALPPWPSSPMLDINRTALTSHQQFVMDVLQGEGKRIGPCLFHDCQLHL